MVYITSEIGSGAFGTVFEIERKDFPDMEAALKVISIPTSQKEIDSYREENYGLDKKVLLHISMALLRSLPMNLNLWLSSEARAIGRLKVKKYKDK